MSYHIVDNTISQPDTESEKLTPRDYFVELYFVKPALSHSESLCLLPPLTSFPHKLLLLYLNRKFASVGQLQLVQSVPDYQQITVGSKTSIYGSHANRTRIPRN